MDEIFDLTYEQMLALRRQRDHGRHLLAVAFRYAGGRWYGYLLLRGGRTERTVRDYLKF